MGGWDSLDLVLSSRKVLFIQPPFRHTNPSQMITTRFRQLDQLGLIRFHPLYFFGQPGTQEL